MSETRENYIAGQKPESYLSYQDFEPPLYGALFRAILKVLRAANDESNVDEDDFDDEDLEQIEKEGD